MNEPTFFIGSPFGRHPTCGPRGDTLRRCRDLWPRDKAAGHGYSAARWTPRLFPGASRSISWFPASTGGSRWTMRWPAIRGSPGSIRATAPSCACCWRRRLRRLGEIEEVLGFLIERPLDGANAAGRQVLRLGAAQLLFLGTPPHAAVDTSVRLVVDAGLPHLKGLANAVLRRISRDGAGPAGRSRPGAAQHAAMAVGQLDRELRRGSHARHRRRPSDRGAARPHDAFQHRLLGRPPGGRGAADRHDPPRGRRQRHRVAGLRRRRVVGAGRRRHAALPGCWATFQASRSPISAPHRAARPCSSPLPAPR